MKKIFVIIYLLSFHHGYAQEMSEHAQEIEYRGLLKKRNSEQLYNLLKVEDMLLVIKSGNSELTKSAFDSPLSILDNSEFTEGDDYFLLSEGSLQKSDKELDFSHEELKFNSQGGLNYRATQTDNKLKIKQNGERLILKAVDRCCTEPQHNPRHCSKDEDRLKTYMLEKKKKKFSYIY